MQVADALCAVMLLWMLAQVLLQFRREWPTTTPPAPEQPSTYQLPREADPEYWRQWH